MVYRQRVPGTVIDAPVYLDANVLVAILVSGHSLAIPCSQMFGELPARQHAIFISDLGLSECLWAIASIAYSRVTGQPRTSMGKGAYRRNANALFAQQGSVLSALTQQFSALVRLPYPISMVPAAPATSERVVSQTTLLMEQLRLTSGDAAHLALAEEYAQTFITCDGDYNIVGGQTTQASQLTVLRVR